jgi:NADPH2:quinone reductase
MTRTQTATMRVIDVTQPGGPEQLTLLERPMPEVGPRDVLIQVAAAGLNRADILQRRGAYPSPKGAPPNPGLEVSGTVAAVGSDAAALPETFFTVWSNVFEFAQLRAGETLLVHGGSSGIGVTAIQLATALGHTVLTTAGSEEKCRFCESLGAAKAINYKTQDFVAETLAATSDRGVDVILDMVGGKYLSGNLQALAIEGRLVMIAAQGGAKGEVDVPRVMQRRLTITGSTLRAREVEFKQHVKAQLLKTAWPLIEQGRIKPIIDSVFAMKDVARAHERMESSAHMGKIVLAW